MNSDPTIITPVEQLQDFLYPRADTSPVHSEAILDQLTPDNFYDFLQNACAEDDEMVVIDALSLFVLYANIEFRDPEVAEEDLTRMTRSVGAEIDNFIDNGMTRPNFAFVGLDEIFQLTDLYNKHNLLALAKTFVEGADLELSTDQLYVLFRYRVTLKMLEEKATQIGSDVIETYRKTKTTKDGARTWAGLIRPYGVETGFIDAKDFGSCDGESAYYETPNIVTLADGSTVRLSGIHSVDAYSSRDSYSYDF